MEKINSFEWAKKVEVALSAGEKKLTELKNELSVIQQKIDESQLYSDLKRANNAARQAFFARMMQRMQELREYQEKLSRASSEVTGECGQAEQNTRNFKRNAQKSNDLLKKFEVDVSEMLLQMLKDTKAELNQRLLEIQEHEYKKRIAEEDYKRVKEGELLLNSGLEGLTQQKLPIKNKIPLTEERSGTIKRGDVMMEEVAEGRPAMANVPRLACDRVQTPSPGPFKSSVLKWFSEEAYIPISRVKDFIEGEEKREDFECKFTIRKTEDRFLSNGKKLIRYWCSFGPADLRKEVPHSVPVRNIPEVGEGSQPSSQRKQLGFSSARGCRCHFAVFQRST